MELKIEGYEFVGRNEQWDFAVARMEDRYLGVAIEAGPARRARQAFSDEGLPVEPTYMHVFAEVKEGYILGMTDKKKAILLVGALAEDPEQGFGGIEEWLVPEDLRGRPADFRCERCGEVGCQGKDCADIEYDYDYPEEEENY